VGFDQIAPRLSALITFSKLVFVTAGHRNLPAEYLG
jgi:hypothetical protein